MESLANYESEDESTEYHDSYKHNDSRGRRRHEEDANYDNVGMDESSEESNNNSVGAAEGVAGGVARRESHEGREVRAFEGVGRDGAYNRRSEMKPLMALHPKPNWAQHNEESSSRGWGKGRGYQGRGGTERGERRHSSDMEMDDGEDDLDNYNDRREHGSKGAHDIPTDKIRCVMKPLPEFRPKHLTNEGAGREERGMSREERGRSREERGLSREERGRSREERGRSREERGRSREERGRSREDRGMSRDERGMSRDERGMSRDERGRSREERGMSKDEKSREERLKEWEKQREEKGKEFDHRREADDKRRKEEREKLEREEERRKGERRDSDEKRKEETGGGRRREDRDRRPGDRRDCGRKRSHTPDRKDRDRGDRGDWDRDRDRGYKPHSRSPDTRPWKIRKLEKKTAVLNKLGIELRTELPSHMTTRQLIGEQLKTQIEQVEARTGVVLPTYYNPGVMNPLKYAQQIQKRRLLWGNKASEVKPESQQQQTAAAPGGTAGGQGQGQQWEGATFKGDSDGKMTEKFKRLMGIKADKAAAAPSGPGEIIQKQEEMFSNMEAQYQAARMATHTHRGVGLGFGTFQVTPR